jgi:hypothetical protein
MRGDGHGTGAVLVHGGGGQAGERRGRSAAGGAAGCAAWRVAVHAESFRADLWDAAMVINQWESNDKFFCSEDTFFGFRGWLVAQGHQVYDAAIADPDSLADYPELGDDLPWSETPWGWRWTPTPNAPARRCPSLPAGRAS